MTESPPPQMEGQVSAPNPLELFWEKHRRTINTVVLAVIVSFGLYYVIAYFKEKQIDQRWSAFAEVTHLNRAYREPDTFLALITRDPVFSAHWGLTNDLLDQVESVSTGEIDAGLAELAGTPAEPLVLWVAARAEFERGLGALASAETQSNFDQAEGYLARLEQGFPKHLLCVESPFPAQWRAEKKNDEESGSNNSTPPPGEEKEYEDSVAGSPVTVLRSLIAKERSFRSTQSRFFEVVRPPEGAARIRIVVDGFGDLLVDLYEDAAPEHIATLLGLIEKKFFDGMHVHDLSRSNFAEPVQEVSFGLPSTKNEPDPAKWVLTDDSDHPLDFEVNDAQRALSNFPGVLCAMTKGMDQSTPDRLILGATDTPSKDGTRTILGMVSEDSMDVLIDIANADIQGGNPQGQPAQPIQIISVEIVRLGKTVPKEIEDKDQDRPGEESPENGDKKNRDG